MAALRTAAISLAATVAITSCTPSQVDPDAAVSISGQATHSDGSPLADRPVGLSIDPGPGVLFWTPFIVGTLGAACLTELCGADHDTETDAEGRYRFDLEGHDVQGTFGEEVDLLLSLTGEPAPDAVAGAAIRVTFVVRNETTVIPTLDLWEPQLSLQPPGSIAWSAAAPLVGIPDRYDALFQSETAITLWSQPATPDGTTVDPRVLEDAQGALAAVAHVPVQAAEGVREVVYRSPSLAFRSHAGAPVSRGAGCAARTDDGGQVPLAPCPATDGILTEPASIERTCNPDETTCPLLTGLEVQLDQTRDVQLVVVRGCEACALDIGESDPVQLTDAFAAVPVSDVSADRVTVRGDISQLAEVSVWDAAPAGGLERLAQLPDTEPVGAGGAPPKTPDEQVPTWLLLVAALLLGSAGTALVLSRSR